MFQKHHHGDDDDEDDEYDEDDEDDEHEYNDEDKHDDEYEDNEDNDDNEDNGDDEDHVFITIFILQWPHWLGMEIQRGTQAARLPTAHLATLREGWNPGGDLLLEDIQPTIDAIAESHPTLQIAPFHGGLIMPCMWKQAVQMSLQLSTVTHRSILKQLLELALRSVGSEKAYGQVIGTVRPILRTYQQDKRYKS